MDRYVLIGDIAAVFRYNETSKLYEGVGDGLENYYIDKIENYHIGKIGWSKDPDREVIVNMKINSGYYIRQEHEFIELTYEQFKAYKGKS
jgi:hypothetical protein